MRGYRWVCTRGSPSIVHTHVNTCRHAPAATVKPSSSAVYCTATENICAVAITLYFKYSRVNARAYASTRDACAPLCALQSSFFSCAGHLEHEACTGPMARPRQSLDSHDGMSCTQLRCGCSGIDILHAERNRACWFRCKPQCLDRSEMADQE